MIVDGPMNSLIEQIIAYEEDRLTQDEELVLFQNLVNSGMAWELQGHYGRTAAYLLSAGLILPGPTAFVEPVKGDS